MRGRSRSELPSGLTRLRDRFVAWRKTRKQGERIPKPLWNSAAKLAVKYGLNQTATVLNLDYYSLQKQVDQPIVDTASDATFIELPSAPMASARECVIEFEDGFGASMRVHLRGTDVPDVLALGRSFWDAQ